MGGGGGGGGGGFGSILGSTATGALTGFAVGGPAGAFVGGAGGLASGIGAQQQAGAQATAAGRQEDFLRDLLLARTQSPEAQQIRALLNPISPEQAQEQLQQLEERIGTLRGRREEGRADGFDLGGARGDQDAKLKAKIQEAKQQRTGLQGLLQAFQPAESRREFRRIGAAEASQTGQSRLAALLGDVGASGGVRAGALAEQASRLPRAFGEIEAQAVSERDQARRNQIAQLLGINQSFTAAPGTGAGQLAGLLGQPGPAGAGLAGFGSTLSALPLFAQAFDFDLFGGGGGGAETFGGGLSLPTGGGQDVDVSGQPIFSEFDVG